MNLKRLFLPIAMLFLTTFISAFPAQAAEGQLADVTSYTNGDVSLCPYNGNECFYAFDNDEHLPRQRSCTAGYSPVPLYNIADEISSRDVGVVRFKIKACEGDDTGKIGLLCIDYNRRPGFDDCSIVYWGNRSWYNRNR